MKHYERWRNRYKLWRLKRRTERNLARAPQWLSGDDLDFKLHLVNKTLRRLGLTDFVMQPIIEAYNEQYDLVCDGLSVPWPFRCMRLYKPTWMIMGREAPHPVGVGHDWLYKMQGPVEEPRRWERSQCDKWAGLALDEFGHDILDDKYMRWLRWLGWIAWRKHRRYDYTGDMRYGRPKPKSDR